MRPRDGGLGTHGGWAMKDDGARTYRDAAARRRALRAGVRAMRDDDAAQWLLRESGRQAVSQNWIPLRDHYYSTIYNSLCREVSVKYHKSPPPPVVFFTQSLATLNSLTEGIPKMSLSPEMAG